jgi:hypothetical protein
LKPVEILAQVVQAIPEIESKIQSDLIIPASAGVEFSANRPNKLSQPALNAHMHIFIFRLPFMTACPNVIPDGLESSNDGLAFSLGQDFSSL